MSTAKKFNYILQFMKTNDISSISADQFVGNGVNIPEKIITTAISLKENSKQTTAGVLVEQQLSVSYNHSTNILNKLINGGIIFRLVRDNQKVVFFGTIDKPAYFDKSSSDLAKGKLTFTRKSTKFEFIEDVTDQFSIDSGDAIINPNNPII